MTSVTGSTASPKSEAAQGQPPGRVSRGSSTAVSARFLASSVRLTLLVAPDRWMSRFRLTGACRVDGAFGLADLFVDPA